MMSKTLKKMADDCAPFRDCGFTMSPESVEKFIDQLVGLAEDAEVLEHAARRRPSADIIPLEIPSWLRRQAPGAGRRT